MSFPFVYPKRVTVVEVGPRDGLQNEAVRVTLEDKVAFVDLLSAAGAPVIEIAAYVRADWVPQMADSGLVAQRITRRPGTPDSKCQTPSVPVLPARQALMSGFGSSNCRPGKSARPVIP